MMANSADRTREIAGKIDNIGNYHAEGDGIQADLTLKARIVVGGVVDSGMDWYIAKARFYTKPQWLGEKEGFSVEVNYSFNSLGEIFTRLKRARVGIESLLAPGTGSTDCEIASGVAKCIYSLEDQTRQVCTERQKAQAERDKYAHGESK